MSISITKEWYALKESFQNYRDNRNKSIKYYTWRNKYANLLKQFKNIHKGEDCFIIGNGPSLNKMDLTKLNDYYTFGLNKIYYIFDRVDLELSYLVSVNKFVIEQSVEEFKKVQCPKFLALRENIHVANFIKNCFPILSSGSFNFQHNILEPISEGGTVTNVALQIAYFMGFQRVFLIGVDHNFVAKGKPNEKQTYKGDDVNHFDPRYFADQKWQLPDLVASEISYMIARRYYENNNRAIFDATVDGKLTVFQKISFEEALRISKKKRLGSLTKV